jgi:hypothetical protein
MAASTKSGGHPQLYPLTAQCGKNAAQVVRESHDKARIAHAGAQSICLVEVAIELLDTTRRWMCRKS